MNYKRKTNRIIYTKATKPGNNIIDADTKLSFGKYKGKTPVDIVIDGDAKYLEWLYKNSSNLKFSDCYKRISGI